MASARSADASPHVPIMVAEVLRHLRPSPDDVAVDCTLGGGGHALAILDRVMPGGRFLGLDVDPGALGLAEARIRAAGHGPDTATVVHADFRRLPTVMDAAGMTAANLVLVDLGVSAMQHDTPARGFSYKHPGPLDLRMDQTTGVPAWQRLASFDRDALAAVLTANADEPHADLLARLIVERRPETTHALERLIRVGLRGALPDLPRADVKMSIRRTFQALRILVNDEFAALDELLRVLPSCLRPGARAVFLTFHSGEDRRVKNALREGLRAGTYATIADPVVRSAKAETFANRRAASAKLRWAVVRA
ncbi:MAG: 16S rRNA (cytosine(1402)-N(4))-methyltransferase RsmH [Acidobacteria bacterium]|nr:16S rRNA (cytosine(1402)-N(4))-methyltransferase RsmH [Acidobacteriota bacterium]